MLLHAFSFQVTSDLVKIACWGSSDDEEIPYDKFLPEADPQERLRAGGSDLDISTGAQKSPTTFKTVKRSNITEAPSNKETKPKTVDKLKMKIYSAKRAMFRRKKKKSFNDIAISHSKIRHEQKPTTLSSFKSLMSMKQGRTFHCKTDVNLQSNKSLLIPDLNLKPIVANGESQHGVFSNQINTTKAITEPDVDENINQESQYETAFNNSAIVNAVCIERNGRLDGRVHFQKLELRSVPSSYWNNGVNKDVLQKGDTGSLPVLPNETISKEIHENKTERLLNIQLHQSCRNQISSKYAASMYDFKKKMGKGSCSNLAKSSKKSNETNRRVLVESVHPERYGSMQAGTVGEISSEPEQSQNSHQSVRLEYIFKNRLGQGDQPSRLSWMERLRSRNSEEKERLYGNKTQGRVRLCDHARRRHVSRTYCKTCAEVLRIVRVLRSHLHASHCGQYFQLNCGLTLVCVS